MFVTRWLRSRLCPVPPTLEVAEELTELPKEAGVEWVAVVLAASLLLGLMAAAIWWVVQRKNRIAAEEFFLLQQEPMFKLRCAEDIASDALYRELVGEAGLLRRQLDEREASVEKLELQTKRLEESLRQATTVRDSLQQQNEALEHQCKVHLETIGRLSEVTATVNATSASHSEQVSALTSSLVQLKKAAELQEQHFVTLHTEKQQLDHKVETLELQRSQLESEVKRLHEQLNTQQCTLQQSEGMMQTRGEEIEDLKHQLQLYEANAEEHRKERLEFVEMMQRLEANAHQTHMAIDAALKEKDALQVKLCTAQEQCRCHETSLAQSSQRYDLLARDFKELQEKYRAQEAHANEQSNELEAIRNLNATYLQTIQSMTATHTLQRIEGDAQLQKKEQDHREGMKALADTIAALEKQVQTRDAALVASAQHHSARSESMRLQVLGLRQAMASMETYFVALSDAAADLMDNKVQVVRDMLTVMNKIARPSETKMREQIQSLTSRLEKERAEHQVLKLSNAVLAKQKKEGDRRLADCKKRIENFNSFKPDVIGRELKAIDSSLHEFRRNIQSFLATTAKRDALTAASHAAMCQMMKGGIATITTLRGQIHDTIRTCTSQQIGLHVGVGLDPQIGPPSATQSLTPPLTPPLTPTGSQCSTGSRLPSTWNGSATMSPPRSPSLTRRSSMSSGISADDSILEMPISPPSVRRDQPVRFPSTLPNMLNHLAAPKTTRSPNASPGIQAAGPSAAAVRTFPATARDRSPPMKSMSPTLATKVSPQSSLAATNRGQRVSSASPAPPSGKPTVRAVKPRRNTSALLDTSQLSPFPSPTKEKPPSAGPEQEEAQDEDVEDYSADSIQRPLTYTHSECSDGFKSSLELE